jgi:hypothetical protein
MSELKLRPSKEKRRTQKEQRPSNQGNVVAPEGVSYRWDA